MSEITQVRLVKRPEHGSREGCWQLTHDPVLGALKEHQLHLKLHYLSIDPGMSGWIADKRSYMPPVKLGGVMRAFGVGEVLASGSDKFKKGDYVSGFTGLQTEGLVDARGVNKVDINLAPANEWLSGLGMTGYTAYFGLTDIGQPKEGETLLVSAAAGAVGSMVGQIGKIKGCRVVGIAGGPEKCRHLTEILGFDAAIDYKAGDIGEALSRELPDGIDLYFDNVGGEILDAVLARINYRGRIVVCGAISQYGDMQQMKGPANYFQLIAQSAKMQGFTMKDYMHRVPEAVKDLLTWKQQGKLVFREHMLDGIEQFPEGFEMLLAGKNHGKLLIKV